MSKKGYFGKGSLGKSMPRLFRSNSKPEVEEDHEDAENGDNQGLTDVQKRIQDEGSLDIDSYGLLSHMTLMWINPLIKIGYKQHRLDKKDLWRIRNRDDPRMLSEKMMWIMKERYWDEENGQFEKYAVWKACTRLFMKDLIISGILEVCYSTLRFAGPVLLKQLVMFVSDNNRTSDTNGYLFGLGLFLSQVLATLCQSNSRFIAVTIGLRVKNAVSYTLFDHVLNLDQDGKQELSNGKVMNLLSTDANVPIEFMRLWNRMWSAPFVLIAGIVYIYMYIGVNVFVGLAVMVLFLPVSIIFGKYQVQFQRKKMKETDKRIKLVSEMLIGVKVMKLNAWEGALLKILNFVRSVEMSAISKLHYFRGITLPFAVAIPNIASVMTFGSFIWMGHKLGPANAFTVVSAFVIIRAPFVTLPLSINMISRALVSESRLVSFLSLHVNTEETPQEEPTEVDNVVSFRIETDEDNNKAGIMPADVDPAIEEQSNSNTCVLMKNASFAWSIHSGNVNESGKEAFQLKNLNLEVPKGELVAIIGRIGDGKSSLASALIGDMKKLEGDVHVNGSIAICTQEPFIMNRTVRANITFENTFDEPFYNDTLRACALLPDLKILPASDFTEIGERGVTLSGGQKQRIQVARAVYSKAEVYILDDILSAVDAHVGQHIFQQCLSNEPGSLLKNTTRLLITNQLHLLEHVDRIVLMENGEIVEQGSYSEIMQRGETSRIKQMHDQYTQKTPEEEEEEVSVPDQDLPPAIAALVEPKKTVEISELNDASQQVERAKGKLTREEKREEGGVTFKTVSAYWLAGTSGSWCLIFLIIFVFVLGEVTFLSIDSWLAYWTQDDSGNISDSTFLYIYFGLCGAFFLTLIIRSLSFATFTIQACRTLYYALQNNVFYLPMSFFWQTPLGRVINRLTKDTNDVDTMLPLSWQWLLMTVMRVMGVLVIISWTTPIFLVAIIPFLLVYLAIREYYRRSSVSAQRIEAILRSPVYSHLSETLQGCTTIKAFHKVQLWLEKANYLVGTNHRAKFAVEAIQIWLSMRLEFLGAMIVFLTAICIVATSADPGLAGLAIAYSLNIVINLNMSVQQATQVEAYMNAVERIIEFTDLECEKDADLKDQGKLAVIVDSPEEAWPCSGKVVFERCVMSYRDNLEPALNDVSFTIESGEKIGIVGKTGSGKSTILVTMFRLHPLRSGSIYIDGVDISTVSLQLLRSVITCIPQDPVLFSTTLRKNIDPFDAYTDEEINIAVKKAHLGPIIEKLPDGLDSIVQEGGDNFSIGERQLIVICRGALRDSRIIFLDEATANVDQETDELIQQSIRSSFPSCTMLIIAHRLNTVLDLDKIMVMSDGKVAEFGPVATLLENQEGKLKQLVKASTSSRQSASTACQ
mmetsp:Transcript_315/g.262  ORF Transcript_315/g.262 Transcript_315/m.262 type:complete len:1379 (-) Transcript_315:315-4451(-)|eukprot:CAMPEP_0203744582 /NCGR_PEP_ID=MMETSP0098-20131031/602_1 /ASSEMBLY_ACC=CAM_ASM_000208 /TAXON_ID=96639 /ORGANISM=" , Strain NY0313808BC1" /LENGTH=1378 /DNA_ID=CAMNT_0050632137 /DNA_START=296 /DNA_END=4432 /DNA_ORIENTATION=+